MYNATFKIAGLGGIIFGRAVTDEKARGESHADFDNRTWQQKCRIADDGTLFLPAIAIKACLTSTAAYASKRIPGKGVATYTKPIVRGLQCVDPLRIDKTIEDIELMRELVRAEPGNPKKGTRVFRLFPYLGKWAATGSALVLDEIITPEVLKEHLVLGGVMTGFGTWRAEVGREFGRFEVTDFQVHKLKG